MKPEQMPMPDSKKNEQFKFNFAYNIEGPHSDGLTHDVSFEVSANSYQEADKKAEEIAKKDIKEEYGDKFWTSGVRSLDSQEYIKEHSEKE